MEDNNIINSFFSQENIEEKESAEDEGDSIDQEDIEGINNSINFKYNPNDYKNRELTLFY